MILMHICCGPCAIYPSKILTGQNLDFDVYFYNPNIHPRTEFEKRKETAALWAQMGNIRIISSDEYFEEPWKIEDLSKEDRCRACYELRISQTCRYAKNNGYDSVTSTLLVSPYQQHDLIIEIFKKLISRNHLRFVYFDFRQGFREGQRIASEMGLYKQKYCGCAPSIQESSYMQRKLQNS